MVTNPTKTCTKWCCHSLSIKNKWYFTVEIDFCWIFGHFINFEKKMTNFTEIWHSTYSSSGGTLKSKISNFFVKTINPPHISPRYCKKTLWNLKKCTHNKDITFYILCQDTLYNFKIVCDSSADKRFQF